MQGGGTENEELRNIGHGTRKVADTNTYFWESTVVKVSYLSHYDTLL